MVENYIGGLVTGIVIATVFLYYSGFDFIAPKPLQECGALHSDPCSPCFVENEREEKIIHTFTCNKQKLKPIGDGTKYDNTICSCGYNLCRCLDREE